MTVANDMRRRWSGVPAEIVIVGGDAIVRNYEAAAANKRVCRSGVRQYRSELANGMRNLNES
jgi:hypothetical protein